MIFVVYYLLFSTILFADLLVPLYSRVSYSADSLRAYSLQGFGGSSMVTLLRGCNELPLEY